MIIPEGQRPTVALAGHIVVPPLPVRGWLAGPSGPLRMQSHFIGRAARGSITPRCCVCVDHENAVCPWRMRAPSSAISFQLGLTAPDP